MAVTIGVGLGVGLPVPTGGSTASVVVMRTETPILLAPITSNAYCPALAGTPEMRPWPEVKSEKTRPSGGAGSTRSSNPSPFIALVKAGKSNEYSLPATAGGNARPGCGACGAAELMMSVEDGTVGVVVGVGGGWIGVGSIVGEGVADAVGGGGKGGSVVVGVGVGRVEILGHGSESRNT